MKVYKLTPTETKALEFVRRYHLMNGYAPTYEEIAKSLRVPTRHHAKYYVYQLRKKGYISIRSGAFKHRKIRLVAPVSQ